MDCPPWTELCGEDPGVAVAWYQAYGDYVRASTYARFGGAGDAVRGLFRGVDSVRIGGHGVPSGVVDGGGDGGVPVRLLVGGGDGTDGELRGLGVVVDECAPFGASGGPGGPERCSAGDGSRCEVPVVVAEAAGGDGGADAVAEVAGKLPGRGSGAGQLKRGPNFARNQASRERKKQAKSARRAGGVGLSDAGVRKGFFSECDEALQKELRESRARMLILENKRKEVQYAREVARLQSPTQLALDVVELLRKTRDDPKLGADPKVMGWAKTVISAEVESVAKSAPNSVPSLDSVVLSESSDSRATEYKRRYEELVLIYDSADCYNPEDRADEFKMLQAEFADVVKGDVEAANRYKFARELRVAIAEAAVNGEYACSRAVEAYLDAAENVADE